MLLQATGEFELAQTQKIQKNVCDSAKRNQILIGKKLRAIPTLTVVYKTKLNFGHFLIFGTVVYNCIFTIKASNYVCTSIWYKTCNTFTNQQKLLQIQRKDDP